MPPPGSPPRPIPPSSTPSIMQPPPLNLQTMALSVQKASHRLTAFQHQDFASRGFARQIELFKLLGPELPYLRGKFVEMHNRLSKVSIGGQEAGVEGLKQTARQVVRMCDVQKDEFDVWWKGLREGEREMIETAHRVAEEVRRRAAVEGGGKGR